MYVVIVGGGKVGFHLGRTVLAKGHEVTLLERAPARARLLLRLLGDVVVQGDGTLPSVLDGAGCARADVLAAVTGDDAVNLLVAVQGARVFQVRRTIARLNDPRNERLFALSGIDATVSSSAILAELIEREVSVHRVRTLLTFPGGGTGIMQLDLSPGSPAAGKTVREIPWPKEALLATVLRAGTALVPGGATRLEAGDRLLFVAPAAAGEALQTLLAADEP